MVVLSQEGWWLFKSLMTILDETQLKVAYEVLEYPAGLEVGRGK